MEGNKIDCGGDSISRLGLSRNNYYDARFGLSNIKEQVVRTRVYRPVQEVSGGGPQGVCCYSHAVSQSTPCMPSDYCNLLKAHILPCRTLPL